MRKVVWVGICGLALGLGVNVASADVIMVVLTGQVTSADTAATVAVGQTVTATYSYDTSSPASGTETSNIGTYVPVAPPAYVSVTAGGQTYRSQNDWTYQITVQKWFLNRSFNYTATPPASSTGAPSFNLSIGDNSGTWPTSTALPTTAPYVNISSPAGASLVSNATLGVNLPNSGSFYVAVTSAALAPALTVSPPSSSFISQQNFDAVLLMPAQYSVTSAQASVNGTNIGFAYPGSCQLAAANSAQRTALVCPNASSVLAGLGGGPTTINWLITLADGSTLQQSVIWNLVL